MDLLVICAAQCADGLTQSEDQIPDDAPFAWLALRYRSLDTASDLASARLPYAFLPDRPSPYSFLLAGGPLKRSSLQGVRHVSAWPVESSPRGLLELSPRCECCIHRCSDEQLSGMCPLLGFDAVTA